jgi:arsenate reductase
MSKKNILILCGGNSCRSQMAEGYFKFFACKAANIYSAGLERKGIHSKALEIMAEDGIDLRGHTCNHVDEYANVCFDYVITVCDTDERCPVFPAGVKQFHYNFPDPALAVGSDEMVANEFRNVREMIKGFAKSFVRQHLLC